MAKQKDQNIEFIEVIENAEGQEMPFYEGLQHIEAEVAKVPNANKAKTSQKH